MIYPIHVQSKFPVRIKRWSKKFFRKQQIPNNQSCEVFANKYDRIYVMNWFMQRLIFFVHYLSKSAGLIRNVPKYFILSCRVSSESCRICVIFVIVIGLLLFTLLYFVFLFSFTRNISPLLPFVIYVFPNLFNLRVFIKIKNI